MSRIIRLFIGLAILSSSSNALATMISGTIDGTYTEFYKEDIWQIISNVTPDTEAKIRLLPKTDKKFVKQINRLQKTITRLLNKAEVRDLNMKQEDRLLIKEDRLLQLLDSRNLLDSLLLAGANYHADFVDSYLSFVGGDLNFVSGNPSNISVPTYSSQNQQHETSVPEPSIFILLGVGLFCLGIVSRKYSLRAPSYKIV